MRREEQSVAGKKASKPKKNTKPSRMGPDAAHQIAVQRRRDAMRPVGPKQVIGRTAESTVNSWHAKAQQQSKAVGPSQGHSIPSGKSKPKPKPKAAPKQKTSSKAAPKGHSSRPKSSSGRSGGGSRGSSGSSGSSKSSSKSPKYTGASQNDMLRQANSSVDLMLNPKLNELRRLLDTVNSDYTKGVNDTNRTKGRQLSDLDTMYGQLDTALQGLKQTGQQAYDTAAGNTNANYDQLDSALQQISAKQRQGAGDELSRLGLSGMNNQQMDADSAFLQGLSQSNRAQAAQLFAANKATAGSVADMQRGDAQFSGTQAKGQAEQAASDLLGELLQQKNSKSMDINSQYADVAGQRGTLLQQMLQQQEQQSYERMMEQRQQDFMNQMSTNRFNLDLDRFNADTAYKNASLALKGQSGASGAKNAGYGKGFSGASAYLDAMTPDSQLANAMKSILQRVDTHQRKNIPGNINNWSQSNYGDFGNITKYMYEYLNDPGFTQYNNSQTRSLLSNALRAYFGQL